MSILVLRDILLMQHNVCSDFLILSWQQWHIHLAHCILNSVAVIFLCFLWLCAHIAGIGWNEVTYKRYRNRFNKIKSAAK